MFFKCLNGKCQIEFAGNASLAEYNHIGYFSDAVVVAVYSLVFIGGQTMRCVSRCYILFGLVLLCFASSVSAESGIIYRNPRVYNVDYSFEMVPDPNKIDRSKDLKLWIPIPREWDSQKAVKIISVEPEPHAKYVDPEYGNPMLFWDFGKEPEQPIYKVDIKFRLESYDVRTCPIHSWRLKKAMATPA